MAEAPAAPALNMRMFAVPAVMLGINRLGIDLTNEDNKRYIQIAFGISQAVVLALYAVLYLLIRWKKDKRKIEVEEKEMSSGEDVKKTYSYMVYDVKQVFSKVGTMMFGLCITAGVYWKFGYIQPLLIQSILQPLNFTGDPLFLIHMLGSDDSQGATKRPFKVDKPGFPGMDMAAALDPKKAEEKVEGKERKKRDWEEEEKTIEDKKAE